MNQALTPCPPFSGTKKVSPEHTSFSELRSFHGSPLPLCEACEKIDTSKAESLLCFFWGVQLCIAKLRASPKKWADKKNWAQKN